MQVARSAKKRRCLVCGKSFAPDDVKPYEMVRPSITDLISVDFDDWTEGKFICLPDLGKYRRRHLERLLQDERGELGKLEQEVISSMASDTSISLTLTEETPDTLTVGERAADAVAAFGGSWTFILSFCVVIIAWMAINVTALFARPFDPYPFILLNLVLSCLAALQAPVIMMSQQRQEKKDRIRAANDYKINLKAELEIRQLHEKIDHQLTSQWERLAEIQELQIEILEEHSGKR